MAFLAVATLLIFIDLSAEGIEAGAAAFRHAAFQTASVMTTTGLVSTDFNLWTPLTALVLVVLMFIGGSAGSTGGAIKPVRILLVTRIMRRELDQTVHREAVLPIRLNGRVIDERTLRAISVFVLLYLVAFVLGALLLVIDGARGAVDLSALEATSAAATTLGNVGPGFGFLGPMGSFEPFSNFSTVVMTMLMWMGRLELLPIVVLLTRSYWRA